MKQLLTILLLILPFLTNAQDDILLSYQKDSVYNDSTQSYDIVYILYDTSGNVADGNFTVKVSTMDSASFIMSLYQKTWTQYNRIGESEGAKINALQAGRAYRNKATEFIGEDGYRQYVMPFVRQAMAGEYVVRYNNEVTRVTLNENGVARDEAGTLILTNAPLSTTWSIFIYRVGENENIECFKINDRIWSGTGSKGRLILRKL